jgi:hypothetical protein
MVAESAQGAAEQAQYDLLRAEKVHQTKDKN